MRSHSRKRRTDDATTHGSLNDWQFNTKPGAKSCLHLPRLQTEGYSGSVRYK